MAERLIAALATPPGRSGLAVIRVSGENAPALADQIFRFGGLPATLKKDDVKANADESAAGMSTARRVEDMTGYRAALGYVLGTDGAPVDQCVLTCFRAPRSYTGEDMVEFSLHGGRFVVKAVLEALYEAGAAPASPGEFTRRAFMNGKLDLSQAEAVQNLINAEAELSASVALSQLGGRLSAVYARYQETLYGLLAALEVSIEYPEHEDFQLRAETLPTELDRLAAELEALLAGYRQGRRLNDGLNVVLAGAPNVGKSSLLNALSGTERAIVTPVAGTTRDTIDACVDIAGLPVRLTDTAGLRDGRDEVERLGVARAKESLRGSDYILWVLAPEQIAPEHSAAEPVDTAAALAAYWLRLEDELRVLPEGIPYTLLLNKEDLRSSREAAAWIQESLLEASRDPRSPFCRAGRPWAEVPPFLLVSAREGRGLEALRQAILTVYQALGSGTSQQVILTSERHVSLTQRALKLLNQLRAEQADLPTDILSQSLQAVAEILAEVTGEHVGERMIDEIFSRFCVGK